MTAEQAKEHTKMEELNKEVRELEKKNRK